MISFFISGKLKGMFDTIVVCGNSLDKYIAKYADTGKSVEIRDVFARFATNVIASVAFGIEIDCIENPDNEFRKYGQKIFQPSFKNILRGNINVIVPKLSKLLGLRFVDKEIGDFMIDTVRQNLEYREQNNVTRKDFFQLLMQLRNTGQVNNEDDDWSAKANSNKKALSLEEIAAQGIYLFSFLWIHLFIVYSQHFCSSAVDSNHRAVRCRFACMNWQKVRINSKKPMTKSPKFSSNTTDT